MPRLQTTDLCELYILPIYNYIDMCRYVATSEKSFAEILLLYMKVFNTPITSALFKIHLFIVGVFNSFYSFFINLRVPFLNKTRP